jgi:hypothetical protein
VKSKKKTCPYGVFTITPSTPQRRKREREREKERERSRDIILSGRKKNDLLGFFEGSTRQLTYLFKAITV